MELRDTMAVALVVDEDGTFRARAEEKADAAAAAIRAIERVAAASEMPFPIAAAAAIPESTSVAAAVASIASRFPGRFAETAVVGSGSAAAIAEAWIGAARDVRDVVYFAVGEHATAGIVRDGRVVLGSHRRAPAVAWLALNPVEREDYRKTGCLEAEVAAAGIVRRFIWRIKAGDRSRVADAVGGDLTAIRVDQVLDAAREGDGVSISVIRDTAKYLGMAAANLAAIADPQMLVLGGIMASAADLLLEPLRVELSRRLPGPMMQALTVVTASLGDDAAAIGAARMAAAGLQ